MDDPNAIPTRLTGKDEMNLADFAIGIIRLSADKDGQQKSTSINREQTIKTPQGLLTQEWIVTASGEYGFPQPCDDDVLLGLIHLAAEDRFAHQAVSFSRYGLCKLMGWVNKGQNYDRIEGALHRLSGVKINAKHSFYDGSRKQYVSKVFGIIDGFRVSESRGHSKENSSFARFSDDLWASIQCNNVKPIDLDTYYALRSPIAKRLYRFLDKRRLNRQSFELELEPLALVNLGLTSPTRAYPSQLKQTLTTPHKELLAIGFLSNVTFLLGSNKAWRVRYTFASSGAGALKRLSAPKKGVVTATEEEMWLVQRGIAGKVAAQLAREHRERIPALLDFYDFVTKKHAGHWKNPIGWLVQAIREGYAVPQDFVDYVPKEKRDLFEADKRRVAELHQQREVAAQELVEARTQRWAAFSEQEREELAAFVRMKSSWLRKLAPDHPAIKAAMTDALDSGEWLPSLSARVSEARCS